ncbi:MAG: hypothetical protein L0154_14210 [Chloroflexi bacterium]|nr:hypothetical protein [Chloroflexota bacterium]
MSESKSGGFFSVFTGTIAGLSVFACAAIACVGVVITGAIVLLALNNEAEPDDPQEQAIAANDGFGSKDRPIRTGEWAIFDDVDMRPIQVVYAPDAEFTDLTTRQNPPPAGEQYVLVQFEIRCKTQECNTRLALTSFWLIDQAGRQWKEPFLTIEVKDDLDSHNASRDEIITGWQAFTFPQNEAVRAILMQWGLGPHLYALPPA